MKLPLLILLYIENITISQYNKKDDITTQEQNSVLKLLAVQALYKQFCRRTIEYMMVAYTTSLHKSEMVGFKLGALFLLKNQDQVHNSERNEKKKKKCVEKYSKKGS